MTYQSRLHYNRVNRESEQARAREQERDSITVGLGNGVVGLTVRDNSRREILQILDVAKIDRLMAELLVARKHLEFAQAIDELLAGNQTLE